MMTQLVQMGPDTRLDPPMMASTAQSVVKDFPALQAPKATRKKARTKTRDRVAKAVVVHAGARDAYQLALALADAGLLQALVTDFFFPADAWWARLADKFLPARVVAKLKLRSKAGLDSKQIRTSLGAAVGGMLLDKAGFLPFSLRRKMTRDADAYLGKKAGRLARQKGCYLISYSYYGFSAFEALGRADMLFQMHPHPATMRRLLREEMQLHPESAASLSLEWELALPEPDFDRLVEETRMARHFLVASSFTRESLIEHGAHPGSISVIPYGVDLDHFAPASTQKATHDGPLRLLFVGRINQRKGLRYLLEALDSIPESAVELTICGRVLDGLELLDRHRKQIVLRPSVDAAALVEAYRRADLLVLPSIAEGFGQVLLEALACGLPILATARTAAPDLICEGVEGFVVAPQRADLLAERIEWALQHRDELAGMRSKARLCAEQFTWERFRASAASAVANFRKRYPQEGGWRA